jgi:hypothetical protein
MGRWNYIIYLKPALYGVSLTLSVQPLLALASADDAAFLLDS